MGRTAVPSRVPVTAKERAVHGKIPALPTAATRVVAVVVRAVPRGAVAPRGSAAPARRAAAPRTRHFRPRRGRYRAQQRGGAARRPGRAQRHAGAPL